MLDPLVERLRNGVRDGVTCQVVLWSVARTGLRPSNGTRGAGVVWGSWWLRGVLGPPPLPTLRVPTPPSAARSSFHGCGEVEAGDAHGHVCRPGEGRKPVRSGSGSRTAQCLRRGSTRGGPDAGRCRPRSRASCSDILPAPEAACSRGPDTGSQGTSGRCTRDGAGAAAELGRRGPRCTLAELDRRH